MLWEEHALGEALCTSHTSHGVLSEARSRWPLSSWVAIAFEDSHLLVEEWQTIAAVDDHYDYSVTIWWQSCSVVQQDQSKATLSQWLWSEVTEKTSIHISIMVWSDGLALITCKHIARAQCMCYSYFHGNKKCQLLHIHGHLYWILCPALIFTMTLLESGTSWV